MRVFLFRHLNPSWLDWLGDDCIVPKAILGSRCGSCSEAKGRTRGSVEWVAGNAFSEAPRPDVVPWLTATAAHSGIPNRHSVAIWGREFPFSSELRVGCRGTQKCGSDFFPVCDRQWCGKGEYYGSPVTPPHTKVPATPFYKQPPSTNNLLRIFDTTPTFQQPTWKQPLVREQGATHGVQGVPSKIMMPCDHPLRTIASLHPPTVNNP